MRRVFYNCGEDWLSTKEFIWLVVNLRFTCRQITGDCTCFRKDCIIELCAGTKCTCKEIFSKFYILAVGCNIPGRSTIVCIVCSCINIVYFRHCCDLPQTLLIFCRHQSSCDPVTIYNTCCLTACNSSDIFIPVIYKFNNVILNQIYIKIDAFLCNFIAYDVSFAIFVYEVSSAGLHHHHQSIATCSFTCKKIFSGFFMNIFTDFHELGPCDICQIINSISCLVKDICTIACNNSTIIKRNTIVCIIYHGIGLFQFTKIIPVNVDIFQICECIRIALQIFLIAVVLHKNDIRKCAVIACICCCCQFSLAVIRRCLYDIYRKSLMIFCILICCDLHRFDVEVLIPRPYS